MRSTNETEQLFAIITELETIIVLEHQLRDRARNTPEMEFVLPHIDDAIATGEKLLRNYEQYTQPVPN